MRRPGARQKRPQTRRSSGQARQLELGCGTAKLDPAFLGVDRAPLPGVDVVADLAADLPFPNDTFDLVYAAHSLEHSTDIVRTMREVYRTCRHGAQVCIVAPYYLTHLNLANPYHKTCFNEHTPRFWSSHEHESLIPETIWASETVPNWSLGASDNSDPGIDFRCLRMEFFYWPEYATLDPWSLQQLRRRCLDVCEEIMYHLVVIKEPIDHERLRRRGEEMALVDPPRLAARRARQTGLPPPGHLEPGAFHAAIGFPAAEGPVEPDRLPAVTEVLLGRAGPGTRPDPEGSESDGRDWTELAITMLNGELRGARRRARALAERLRGHQQESREQTSRLEKVQSQLDQESQMRAEALARLAQVEQQLAQKGSLLEDTHRELDEARVRARRERANMEGLLTQVNAARQEADALGAELRRAREEGQGAFAALERAGQQASEREGVVADLRRRLDDASAQVEGLASQLGEVSAEKDRVASQLGEVAAEKERVARDLGEAAAERERVARDLAEASAERETLGGQLEQLRGELGKTTADLEGARGERERDEARLQRSVADAVRLSAWLQPRPRGPLGRIKEQLWASDGWAEVGIRFQPLKDEAMIQETRGRGWRLALGPDLRLMGQRAYPLRTTGGRAGGVQLAAFVWVPEAGGKLAVEVLGPDRTLVAKAERPLAEWRPDEPFALAWPPCDIDSREGWELRVSVRDAAAPVQLFELVRHTQLGLGPSHHRPFCAVAYEK